MWTIRRARRAHLGEINEVIRGSKSYWRQPPEYLRAALALLTVDEDYLARNLCFEVADDASRIVCFFAVEDDGVTRRLEHLWVRPEHLRRGLGRLACEHLITLARARGWPELLVLPEPPAEEFYRRLGFRDTGERVPSRVAGGPSFSVLAMRFAAPQAS